MNEFISLTIKNYSDTDATEYIALAELASFRESKYGGAYVELKHNESTLTVIESASEIMEKIENAKLAERKLNRVGFGTYAGSSAASLQAEQNLRQVRHEPESDSTGYVEVKR